MYETNPEIIAEIELFFNTFIQIQPLIRDNGIVVQTENGWYCQNCGRKTWVPKEEAKKIHDEEANRIICLCPACLSWLDTFCTKCCKDTRGEAIHICAENQLK